MSSQFRTPRRRRRSSSLSPDLKITRLEQELERCAPFEAEIEAASAKVAKLQKDMLALENDKMASERRALREIGELKELVEQKEDDIVELKRVLQEAPDSAKLQEQLKLKEERLGYLNRLIGGISRTLETKSEELVLLAEQREERHAERQRAGLPPKYEVEDDNVTLPPLPPSPSIPSIANCQTPALAALRTPSHASVSSPKAASSYPDPAPLAKINQLTSDLASKEGEIAAMHQSASCREAIPDSSVMEELSALRGECAALEKELNDAQTSLEDSRLEARQSRQALQLYKAEMQVHILFNFIQQSH